MSYYSWLPPEDTMIALLQNRDLLGYILNSSAYHKKLLPSPVDTAKRSELIAAYNFCRNYATTSIISGLTPLHSGDTFNCADQTRPFRILARVQTEYDQKSFATNAARRLYQSFSILENSNLSHFPGEVLYGYYSGITSEMIGYIYPMDGNTAPAATDRLSLTLTPEILLDLEDLVLKAHRHKSYAQVSVSTRTRSPTGEVIPLLPDCVIAIDEANPATQLAAKTHNLPIIPIYSTPDTLCNIHDAGYSANYWNEWILPFDPTENRYDAYDSFDVSANLLWLTSQTSCTTSRC